MSSKGCGCSKNNKDKAEVDGCFTLVMGCCATKMCGKENGPTCGCGPDCQCGPQAACMRTDVRVKPDLGGGYTTLIVGTLIIAAAAGFGAYMYKKKQAS